jgi:WD40 repeat protein
MRRRLLKGILCIFVIMMAFLSGGVIAQTDNINPDITVSVPGLVKHVSFSEDGDWLIVGYTHQNCLNCPGAVIAIYDIASGSQIYTFDYDEATEDHLAVALSPDNEYLYATNYYLNPYDANENRIAAGRLWTVESGERLLTQDLYLIHADWNPNNQLLLWYGETLMWIGQQITELTLDAHIYHGVWSPDFETVYAFTADGNFHHVDLRNGAILSTTTLATGENTGLRGFDGYYVLIAKSNGGEIWTVASGEPEKVYETATLSGHVWMDRGYLFRDMGGDFFVIYDNATGESIYSLNYREELEHNGWMARLDAYHNHVIYAILDESSGQPCPTYIYDIETEETATLNANFLTPHPTQPLVLASSCESGISDYMIYDLEDDTVVATLARPEGTSFIPIWNGQTIAAWEDGTVYVWSSDVQ